MEERIRFGGMALPNGVLVHSARHWACAIRTRDGELRVASGLKPVRAVDLKTRALRGPARVAEVLALLARVKRELPEAELPFQRPQVGAAVLGGALLVRSLRQSSLRPALQETLAALAALSPAAVALRLLPELAAYHGAEHISIGSYEHGEARPREHERCGTHMLGPLLATSALGGLAARRTPPAARPLARLAGSLGALAASTELFSWMVRNPEHPVARALARPGHELQRRFATAEPTAEQLEVAAAALSECLRLEDTGSAEVAL